MMKRLLSAKSMLLTALCFGVVQPAVDAKTMYKWVDEKGKVSFSDQVPPSKAELGHQELDKNAQVVKVSGKAKTKAELEIAKRLILLKKQQELTLAQQKAHDKKLLSSFITVEAMDVNQKAKELAFKTQTLEKQEQIKALDKEIVEKQKEAAGYEIKNKKIPKEVLDKIEDSQKKIAKIKQEIKQLDVDKAADAKEFVIDRARYVFLTKSSDKTAAPLVQPGLFSCDSSVQCDKAWGIAKEFVRGNSVAKIAIDSDALFMSEDPVSEDDLNLAISKVVAEGKNPEIFLDIRCTETATAKGLCSSPKANEIRTRFTDYLKEKLGAGASPAPAAPPPAAPAAKAK